MTYSMCFCLCSVSKQSVGLYGYGWTKTMHGNARGLYAQQFES